MTQATTDVVAETPPAADIPGEPTPSAPGRLAWLRSNRMAQAALALIAVQLVVRTWVTASSYLWYDDFILAGRGATLPLFSADLLFYDHDGHFMPAGFFFTGLMARLAPMEWWPLALTLVVLQALAALSVWRLLRLLIGDRLVLLLPLAIYLFSPLTLPTFSWYAAAINALPLQICLPWVCAEAVLLMRTGRLRHAVSGTVALAVSFAFFEKSVVIAPVAFAMVVLLQRFEGSSAPLVTAFRRCLSLWVGLGLVLVGWGVLYATVAGSPTVVEEAAARVPAAVDGLRMGIFEAFLPTAIGGPLAWAEPGEATTPPSFLVVAAVLVAVAAVVWTAWRRRGGGLVWWLLAAYVGAGMLAVVLGRLGGGMPPELLLNLRYHADSAVVLALVVALVAIAPARTDVRRRELVGATVRRAGAALAAACFLLLSGWSTAGYVDAFGDSLPRDYVATARASLAEHDGERMLDQGVPARIMWGLAYPNNLASLIFAPLEEKPVFGDWATELRLVDEDGHVVDARVTRKLTVVAGPQEGCGHLVSGNRPTVVGLDGELFPYGWTVQLNYLASEDGSISVAWQDGFPITVPVSEGPGSVFLSLPGGGSHLRVASQTEGLGVCIDTGLVGDVVPVTGGS